jgi:large subunit ribosomal protein L22
MKARLQKYTQSPRKVRLVADSVRGLTLDKALKTLEFMPKKSAKTLHKLLISALANTGESDYLNSAGNYYIKTLQVDEGPRYRRFRPGFRGRADQFYRRSSHVTVELAKHNKLTPAK